MAVKTDAPASHGLRQKLVALVRRARRKALLFGEFEPRRIYRQLFV